MKTLFIATAPLTLAVMANLSPAAAQGRNRRAIALGSAFHSASTAARHRPSQQPRFTSTNTVTTTMEHGEAIGFSSVTHSLPEGFQWVRRSWPAPADPSSLPSIAGRNLSAPARCFR
jgi:hypothetical protein